MADTKVYAGKEGIQELWRRIKAEIGKFTAFERKPAAPDGTPDVHLADRKTNIIYLVEDPTAPSPDHYKEWIWTLSEGSEGEWVRIGDTSMDLSDMARKSEMSVESVQGDPTKATIQLNTNLVQEVVIEHQDISGKQDVISDLASIRTGAAAGATAYQKPNTGIPSSDMTATVQASLSLADSAVQPAALATKQDKPSSSTAGDIATFDSGSSTVDSGKAFLNSTGTWDGTSDSLVPTAKSIQSKLDEKYTRPASGIPTTDLDSAVNASLGKADSAIQHVYAGPDELVPDNTKTVTIPYAEVIPAHVVTIGGRAYKAVVIGGKEWLAENLDFKFDGLTIGQGASEYEPRANYYNKDETTYGVNGNKYGLLYNWLAVKYLTDNKSELIPGWHVPTKAEWDALATAVGGASVAGTKLKSTTGWSSGNGDGTYGFDAVPAGEQYQDQFSNLSNYANFWTADDDSTANRYYRSFNTGTSMTSSYSRKDWGISVRLVRDTTSTDDPTFKGGLLTTSMVEKLDGIEAHAEVNVQADWNVSDSASDAFVRNKPSLATVATSGSYNDLTTKAPVFAGSTAGLVPAATAGDSSKALRGDGTWGDVSSVSVSYDSVNEELHLDFSAGGN